MVRATLSPAGPCVVRPRGGSETSANGLELGPAWAASRKWAQGQKPNARARVGVQQSPQPEVEPGISTRETEAEA